MVAMNNQQIATEWGRRIREARETDGLSVIEFAQRLNVSRTAVYKWESGETAPTPEMQLRIAAVLERPHIVLFHLVAS